MRRRAVPALQTAVLLAVVIAHLLGVRLVPVLTGSMTPWAATGALVVTVPVAGPDVAVGDVVAFRPPPPFEVPGGRPVLHRVETVTTVDGGPAMTTRGDANPAADPWQVALGEARLARAVLVVPLLGRALAGGPGPALAVLAGTLVLVAGLRRVRPARAGVAACPDCPPAPA